MPIYKADSKYFPWKMIVILCQGHFRGAFGFHFPSVTTSILVPLHFGRFSLNLFFLMHQTKSSQQEFSLQKGCSDLSPSHEPMTFCMIPWFWRVLGFQSLLFSYTQCGDQKPYESAIEHGVIYMLLGQHWFWYLLVAPPWETWMLEQKGPVGWHGFLQRMCWRYMMNPQHYFFSAKNKLVM